jgi:hypothetical protein
MSWRDPWDPVAQTLSPGIFLIPPQGGSLGSEDSPPNPSEPIAWQVYSLPWRVYIRGLART